MSVGGWKVRLACGCTFPAHGDPGPLAAASCFNCGPTRVVGASPLILEDLGRLQADLSAANDRARVAEQALTAAAERLAHEWEEWRRIGNTPNRYVTDAEEDAYDAGCGRLRVDLRGTLAAADIANWVRTSPVFAAAAPTTRETDE